MTDEERIKAYQKADATIIGRVSHSMVDMARATVGKPPVWHEIRRLEIQVEQRQATAQRLAAIEVPRAVPARATQVAERLAKAMDLSQQAEAVLDRAEAREMGISR